MTDIENYHSWLKKLEGKEVSIHTSSPSSYDGTLLLVDEKMVLVEEKRNRGRGFLFPISSIVEVEFQLKDISIKNQVKIEEID